MISLNQKYNCCGCQACAQSCPKGCISMAADDEGFLYPVVDEARCVQCGLCEKVCPELQSTGDQTGTLKAYAAWNLDENIRLASSSGGVFTLLAEYVLEQGGAVYGAAMEGSNVKHIRATDAEELPRLRGSKYVQSDIGTTYSQAKQDLKTGKDVLFTGTPCQIEGLRAFLQKDYSQLVCMDIICHGVPSPMVWQKYVALREKAAGAPAARMFFRHKKYGWKTYAVLFEFSNKTAYARRFGDDPFMQVFLHDLCLRPSCYQCSFKKINRISDITVADFWGIKNVCPKMDDDKGTSLVIIHSKKGQEIFQSLGSKMNYQEVPFEAAIRGNPAMIRSAKKPKLRDTFMQRIQTGDFEKLAAAYAKDPVTATGVLKKLLKKAGLLEIAKKLKKRLSY